MGCRAAGRLGRSRAVRCVLIVFGIACSAAHSQAAYIIKDLGLLTVGGTSVAYGVNSGGTAACGYADGNKAFRWLGPAGPIQNLGTLGGASAGAEAVNV